MQIMKRYKKYYKIQKYPRLDDLGGELPKYIYWCDVKNRYVVKITRRPKVHHVGTFHNLKEAIAALKYWCANNIDKLPRREFCS